MAARTGRVQLPVTSIRTTGTPPRTTPGRPGTDRPSSPRSA